MRCSLFPSNRDFRFIFLVFGQSLLPRRRPVKSWKSLKKHRVLPPHEADEQDGTRHGVTFTQYCCKIAASLRQADERRYLY